jgi:Tol biopolymer transport system component
MRQLMLCFACVLATVGCAGQSTSTTAGASFVHSASSAPAATLTGRIIFSRVGDEFGHATVFIANADGTNERQVSETGAVVYPRLSPDGETITVMPNDQLPAAPITGSIMKLDGTGLERLSLTDPTLNLVPSAWSPDGTRIAFEGWDDSDPSRTGVYTALASDGTDLVRLTSVEVVHDMPADYSPDGARILFYRAGGAEPAPWDVGGSLWTVSTDGTGPRRIETPGVAPSWWARWSPDGDRILFASERNAPLGAIWTVDADGSNLTKVFEDPDGRFPISPTWSPDGSQIMFVLDPHADQFQHPPNEIYVINADGSGLQLVMAGDDFKVDITWAAP